MLNFLVGERCIVLLLLINCKLCSSVKGDVYPVEQIDDYPFNQVLDAHWGVLNEEDVSDYFLFLISQKLITGKSDYLQDILHSSGLVLLDKRASVTYIIHGCK